MRTRAAICAAALLLSACSGRSSAQPELHVAAAANLTRVLHDLGAVFERRTGIHIVPSYGATAQLTQQIENGAPYDVFLAADVDHVDRLINDGFILRDSRAIYARGRLVVWAPKRPEVHTLDDLVMPGIRTIVIAKPELAPYGAAAIEALKKARLWDRLEPRIVYAPSISSAKQFADTGNGDAAFTAFALTIGQTGNAFAVDERLYKPIDQALGIIKNSMEQPTARAFTRFLASVEAREILLRSGYGHRNGRS
jgi:molybdate transport system substrate-binding protein